MNENPCLKCKGDCCTHPYYGVGLNNLDILRLQALPEVRILKEQGNYHGYYNDTKAFIILFNHFDITGYTFSNFKGCVLLTGERDCMIHYSKVPDKNKLNELLKAQEIPGSAKPSSCRAYPFNVKSFSEIKKNPCKVLKITTQLEKELFEEEINNEIKARKVTGKAQMMLGKIMIHEVLKNNSDINYEQIILKAEKNYEKLFLNNSEMFISKLLELL